MVTSGLGAQQFQYHAGDEDSLVVAMHRRFCSSSCKEKLPVGNGEYSMPPYPLAFICALLHCFLPATGPYSIYTIGEAKAKLNRASSDLF